MASKNRGKIWSDEATLILIQLWSEETIQISLETSKSSKSTAKVYQTLLLQLQGKGYNEFTQKEVMNKIKKLRQKYKTDKDKTRRSGTGARKKWKFFDEIDRFLTNRHNVTPPALVDTMAESDLQLDKLSDSPSTVDQLVEEYGHGETSLRKCNTCDYEQEMRSSGVHTCGGGSVMVFSDDDEFSCPKCDVNTSNAEKRNCESDQDDSAPKEQDDSALKEQDDVGTSKGNLSLAPRKKKKSNVEKSLEVVFDKFKKTASTDFERYQKLEEERIKNDREFRIQQLQLENERRKEEREHEFNMLRMVLGQQASSSVVPSSYHPFHVPDVYGTSSSNPHRNSDSSDSGDYVYPTHGAPTYFKM